jgi:cell division ATPase FtsA
LTAALTGDSAPTLIRSIDGKGSEMSLCDWYAGIDINGRDVSAAIGSSQGGSPPRIHASRSFAAESELERAHAVREIGEWLRLESGGSLSRIALTVPGDAYQSLPSSGECRFSEPTIVDDEMVALVRQRALVGAGFGGPVLCSTARAFVCDGRTFPEAPLGLSVRSLKAEVINWVADPRYVQSVTGLLDDIGFTPGFIAPRVVAIAEAVLDPMERDRGVVVLCVSEEFTEVVAYRDGQLDDLFVIPLGKARLDGKLASACGISLDLMQRIDLGRMLGSSITDPVVQHVRTIVSAWSLSLMRVIRERLDAVGPIWQLRSGMVIADSAGTLPLVAETARRVIGTPARVAVAEWSIPGAGSSEPLASRGLIPLQWHFHTDAVESLAPMTDDPDFGGIERDERRGLGPVIGRWLREFVPADHAP